MSAGGVAGDVPWMQAVTDQTDIPLAVARAKGTYATAIKLYADLSPTLAERITSEAHRQNMLVWAHATLYPAKPSQVVAAGVDAISHACLLARESSASAPAWSQPRAPVSLEAFRSGRNPALQRLFTEMVRRGTILDATLWTYSAARQLPQPCRLCRREAAMTPSGGAITGQAYRSGVLIDAGTDNVAEWTDQWPDLFHELAILKSNSWNAERRHTAIRNPDQRPGCWPRG